MAATDIARFLHVRRVATRNLAAFPIVGTPWLDGAPVQDQNRVLVVGQTKKYENGVYIVNPATPWTRLIEASAGTDFLGMTIVVREGTKYADSIWQCMTDGAITVNDPPMPGDTDLLFRRIPDRRDDWLHTDLGAPIELTDADQTIKLAEGAHRTIPLGLLTADRIIRLEHVDATRIRSFTISRSDTSRFRVKICDDTTGQALYELDIPGSARFVYSGTPPDGKWKWARAFDSAGVTIVNPKALGAKGDGVTDDAAAFQAALDFFGPPTYLPGRIVVPQGTYLITKRLLHQGRNGSGLHLEGDVGATQAPLGAELKWNGAGPDEDALKVEFTASAMEETYKLPPEPAPLDLNGTGPGLTDDHPDPRHVTVTLIGPPEDFINDGGPRYGSVKGTDDRGNSITDASNGVEFFFNPTFEPQHLGPDKRTVDVSQGGVDTNTDTITTTAAHGFAADDAIRFYHASGDEPTNPGDERNLPKGLFSIRTYFVTAIGLTATSFKVAKTRGGDVIHLQSPGTGTFTVAKTALTFRSRERMMRVTEVTLPKWDSTRGKIRIGWDGGTILELRGLNGGLIENLDFNGNSLATYCVIQRFNQTGFGFDPTGYGASGNVYRRCTFRDFRGPNSAGLAFGQTDNGTGGQQSDETLMQSCLFISPWNASDDECGVKMLDGDNVTAFRFIDSTFSFCMYGVSAGSGNGPIGMVSCSWGNMRGACVRGGGGATFTLLEPNHEQNNFGTRIFQALGGSFSGTVRILGGHFRTIAPDDDDYVIVTSSHLFMSGVHLWNRRLQPPDGRSVPKILIAGSAVVMGCDFQDASADTPLFFDSSGNDLVSSAYGHFYPYTVDLPLMLFGNVGVQSSGADPYRMPPHNGASLRSGREVLVNVEGARMRGNPAVEFKNTNPDTIERKTGSWAIDGDGFVAGMKITVSGSGSNDGTFTIETLTPTTITLHAADTLTAQGAIVDVTIIQAGFTPIYTGVPTRHTSKVTLDWRAFLSAAPTFGRRLAVLPPKTRIVGVIADTTEQYLGGSLTAVRLEVGINGVDLAGYLLPHDVTTAKVVKGLLDADLGLLLDQEHRVQGGHMPSWTAPLDLYATLVGNAALSELVQGSTTFYVAMERML